MKDLKAINNELSPDVCFLTFETVDNVCSYLLYSMIFTAAKLKNFSDVQNFLISKGFSYQANLIIKENSDYVCFDYFHYSKN